MRKTLFTLLVSLLLVAVACEPEVVRNEPELPLNPFDTLSFEEEVLEVIEIDSSSFLGLHTYILKPTCAVPGCHDGAFEPDFRTLHSAYNTLVYSPVVKNDILGTFEYRVVPGDTASSWLYERITTDDEILGRMPLYDTLYPYEREKITEWINNGAPDVLGNSPILPNYQPVTYGFLAYENDTNGIRLDENRADIMSPIALPPDTEVEIWFGVYDTDEFGTFIPSYNLTYNKARISKEPLFFTDPVEYDMEVEPASSPFMGPLYWDPLIPISYYQHFTFNTSDYESGTYYFLRFYVKDADHDQPTEIPNQGSPFYWITLFSFFVE